MFFAFVGMNMHDIYEDFRQKWCGFFDTQLEDFFVTPIRGVIPYTAVRGGIIPRTIVIDPVGWVLKHTLSK